MRLLFCNIAYMNYYKGRPEMDPPIGGGSWVAEHGFGGEMYNFKPEMITPEGAEGQDQYCLGFFETKSNKGKTNQLHIEKIRGCELLGHEESAEDVLVIWCATHPAHKFTTVVGWYKHATVFRNYQVMRFDAIGGGDFYQDYNVLAKTKDCVLLPTALRSRKAVWEAPRRKAKGRSYGFGRANVWFAEDTKNPEMEKYLKELVNKIEKYSGENWIDKYPEDIND